MLGISYEFLLYDGTSSAADILWSWHEGWPWGAYVGVRVGTALQAADWLPKCAWGSETPLRGT